VLDNLILGKYDGCLRCFHALFFIYTHHGLCCLFYYICGTADNNLIGQIPTELQTLPLGFCDLSECRAFSLPFPFVLLLQGFSHTLAIVIFHIVAFNCFVSVVGVSNCDTRYNCE
jgi:hypothetical protein